MSRLDDFDEQEDMGGQVTAHIWLRYATQFTSGDRSYTIDIGIPVPLGADAATREQLLREADAGLDQLANYVERRVMQVAQQSGSAATRPATPSRPVSPPVPAPTPAAAPTPISLPASTPAVQSAASASKPQTSAASTPPAHSGTGVAPSPAIPLSQAAPQKEPAPAAAPGHPDIGASMPPSPGLPAGTLSLPEFLKYLKEMGLDARRAMTLLKVKSLSGLNLREALEQLQHILMQEGGSPAGTTPTPSAQAARGPTSPQAPAQNQPSSSRTTENHPASNPVNPGGSGQTKAGASSAGTNRPTANIPQTPQTPSSTQVAPPSTSASGNQGRPFAQAPVSPAAPPTRPSSNPGTVVRSASASPAVANGAKQTSGEPRPLILQEEKLPYPVPVVFDEEEDEDEQEDFDLEEDEEEQEASFGTGVGLSAANRGSAEDIVSRLREAGGSSAVSATRLKALHNVLDGQLTAEQLQALIHGVWGAASEKKLKGEQAEALISWGKQDEFVAEAEMVLALFEENGNASSNR
ncbi:MAG TPA: hypothetical protein VKV40_09845 [Ktedonobacteraceae bacterium]|nr:hypothetical protein [Ktedonobacteraceae bacterium]